MRDLKPGDPLKIIGPWVDGFGGGNWIGEYATVVSVAERSWMAVEIRIVKWKITLNWCRENLRALPRPK